MYTIRSSFVAILVFASATIISGQGTGVRTEYLKDDNSTKVDTNMLYLLNTDDQFVQITFGSIFKGQDRPASPPKKIDIQIYSFSKKAVFKDRSLVVITDTEEAKLGSLSNTIMKSEAKRGLDTFYATGGSPNVGMQVPIPQSAQIRNDPGLSGLTMELMMLALKPEQFLKFANSPKIAFRVGDITLSLNDRHVEIVRNFAQQITPK